MSGHSKWHRIKHKKTQTDSRKSKLFSQLARDITSAARDGTDPANNAALREALERAKQANMPATNINRLLQTDSNQNEEVTYEAFGPQGISLLIIAHTDNTRRTVAELRSLLKQHGGTLGEPGSVSWKFKPQILITVPLPQPKQREALELALIDAGATDIMTDQQELTVTSAPKHQTAIKKTIRQFQLIASSTTKHYAAQQQQPLTTKTTKQLHGLLRDLRHHPDVAGIFTDAADVLDT